MGHPEDSALGGKPEDSALGGKPEIVSTTKIDCDKAFAKFGALWIANFWSNVNNMTHENSHSLSKFEAMISGKPLIICGAGESIFAELDTLWSLQGHAHIASLDHLWRWLPCDSVFSLDGQAKINDLFFDGFERDIKGRALVVSTHSQPIVVQAWLDRGGDVYWFHPEYGDSPSTAWAEKDKRCREALPAELPTSFVRFNCFGQAIITAARAKATPIVLVGIDLAWTKRYYADDERPCYSNLLPLRGFVSDIVYNKAADGSLEGPAWTTPTLQMNREILKEATEGTGAKIVAAGSGATLLGPRKSLRQTIIDTLPDLARSAMWL